MPPSPRVQQERPCQATQVKVTDTTPLQLCPFSDFHRLAVVSDARAPSGLLEKWCSVKTASLLCCVGVVRPLTAIDDLQTQPRGWDWADGGEGWGPGGRHPGARAGACRTLAPSPPPPRKVPTNKLGVGANACRPTERAATRPSPVRSSVSYTPAPPARQRRPAVARAACCTLTVA